MKSINEYLLEGLKINSKTKLTNRKSFSEEELRDDYNSVWAATSKKEKQDIALKYGTNIIRIRPIQITILDILREKRFDKTKYDLLDIKDFFRYDLPQKYDNLKEYLDKEPLKFVEFLYDTYVKKNKKIHKRINWSIADKQQLKREDQFKKYLGL